MEESEDASLHFELGKKRGVGGTKRDVQFYDSFTFGGVQYSLYDCVYTYKTGEPHPYIGKIVKIWEQGDGKKRVKLLWFFHPREIVDYLEDHQPLDNELFLACGEGAGLANINPLDVIFHAFKQSVTAKIIPLLPPYHNPHYGQAYVIFKTRDAADAAVQKINTEHLMLSNGSPFIACKGMLVIPPKATTFVGHLEIKRVKMMQREETRKAVSTSHCSQPNTIEYEMAMDCIFLHEKTANSFNRIYKVQRDERKKVTKDLKTH